MNFLICLKRLTLAGCLRRMSVLLLAVLAVMPLTVQAACSPIQIFVDPVKTPEMNDPAAPTGAVIAKAESSWPQVNVLASDKCASDLFEDVAKNIRKVNEANMTFYAMTPLIAPNVYATNLKNVGYRVRTTLFYDNSPNGAMNYWPYSYTHYYRIIPTDISAGTIYIEFIKLNSLPAESLSIQLPNNTVGEWNALYSSKNYKMVEFKLNGPINIDPPKTKACTVQQSIINVELDDALQSDFATSQTAHEKNFSIPLKCDSTTPVSLRLAFTGTTIGDNSLGIFGDGFMPVGFQILKDGNPVFANSADPENATNIGSVMGETAIPFTARYYSLTPTPPTMALDATAYATILYN